MTFSELYPPSQPLPARREGARPHPNALPEGEGAVSSPPTGEGQGGRKPAQPLRAKTVLVTRPQGQAGRLVEALAGEGARAIEVPAIQIEPPFSWDEMDRAIREGG